MIRYSRILVVLSIIFFSFSCNVNGDCLNKDGVKKMLFNEMQLGASREAIEMALNNMGINFSYDRFRERYQITLRDDGCSEFKAISVYIHLDKSQKLSKIQVFESFTMP